MKETYTKEEVIQLLTIERERAREICYDARARTEKKAATFSRINCDEMDWKCKEVGEALRITGNHISGGDALGAVLGETVRDRIEVVLNGYNHSLGDTVSKTVNGVTVTGKIIQYNHHGKYIVQWSDDTKTDY